MSQVLDVDVKEIVLASGAFGPRQIDDISSAIANDYSQYLVLRDSVTELASREDRSPATAVRLGVASYLTGRFKQAKEVLSKADGGALAHFYLGKSQAALEEYDDAIKHYRAAAKAGYNGDACALAEAEALRLAGRTQNSLQALDNLSGPVEQTAEYLYQRAATVGTIGGNPSEVIALYERACQVDPLHAGALMGLARENERHGNDDEALRLYERAAARFPSHVGVLLNLGLLYDDRGEFEKAVNCFRRILEVFPNHFRARLFLKDSLASGDMYYDEDAERRRDRLAQILSVPVTDFELSVRSRNCLEKMGIRTLGDLTRCTESDLLASKNFGETSLTEIREMLSAKGLRLGQFADEKRPMEPAWEPETLSPDEQAMFDRPIADLNLSVRARKCMVRLGITTIGELVRRTGDDLLECKNFGVTSLNEVREKLTAQALKLRGD